MECKTIKDGVDCFFMKSSGCSYTGGACVQIAEQCRGCGKMQTFSTGDYCSSFPDPTVKWKVGICNMATHIKAEAKKQQKINPIKASKRGH